MKKQLLMILMIGIVGLGISGCEDPLADGTTPEEIVLGEVTTETIMKVMSMRFRALGLAEDFRFNGFEDRHDDEEGRANDEHRRRNNESRNAGNLGRRGFKQTEANRNDTSSHDKNDDSHRDDKRGDDEDYGTCAEVTEVENTDGSFTITIDYGTGCREHDAFIAGKIIITEIEKEGKFRFEMIFENYSETYESDSSDVFDLDSFTLNGFFRSNGTFEEFEGSMHDDECHYGDFTESHKSEMTITFADGSWEEFKSTGEISETEESFKVLSENFRGTNSEGDTFSGTVTETLVLDYNCDWDVFVFTSGIEDWTVNGNNISIDFGDGRCDNIISITKGGITVDIDLDKSDWFEDDHDDG